MPRLFMVLQGALSVDGLLLNCDKINTNKRRQKKKAGILHDKRIARLHSTPTKASNQG